MLFAETFGEWLCTGFGLFLLIGTGIVWLISQAFKSDTVQEAAKISFWTWFFYDD